MYAMLRILSWRFDGRSVAVVSPKDPQCGELIGQRLPPNIIDDTSLHVSEAIRMPEHFHHCCSAK
jgi:hypothetical protein